MLYDKCIEPDEEDDALGGPVPVISESQPLYAIRSIVMAVKPSDCDAPI